MSGATGAPSRFTRAGVPRLAYAMRTEPGQIEPSPRGSGNDFVDAFFYIPETALGVVGPEKHERRGADRRLSNLRERLRTADMDTDVGEILLAGNSCNAIANAVTEHVRTGGGA